MRRRELRSDPHLRSAPWYGLSALEDGGVAEDAVVLLGPRLLDAVVGFAFSLDTGHYLVRCRCGPPGVRSPWPVDWGCLVVRDPFGPVDLPRWVLRRTDGRVVIAPDEFGEPVVFLNV
jgi:hypothetical protein